MATPLRDGDNRIELILDAARSLGVRVLDAPPTWTGDRFNTEMLSIVQRDPLPDRIDRDLPRAISAVTLDNVPVLLGELDNPPRSGCVSKTHFVGEIRR